MAAEETPFGPILRLRFFAHILGAEAVDADPRNALEAMGKQKPLSGYKVALVAILPEGDAGTLLALGKGHKVLLETLGTEDTDG